MSATAAEMASYIAAKVAAGGQASAFEALLNRRVGGRAGALPPRLVDSRTVYGDDYPYGGSVMAVLYVDPIPDLETRLRTASQAGVERHIDQADPGWVDELVALCHRLGYRDVPT